MDWWWAYLAVGVFVGFFSGLLGIGGGAAMVPLLAFIFAAKGFAAQYVIHLALGTCVAAIMFTAVSSARSHHRHKAVNWEILRRLFPGVIVGALLIYFVQYKFLSDLPHWTNAVATTVGLPGNAVTSLSDLVTRLNFVLFGLILVVTMLLRPQGLIPSRIRQEELTKGTHEGSVAEVQGVA